MRVTCISRCNNRRWWRR